MFIPIHQNAQMLFNITGKNEITLICRPVTGINEEYLLNALDADSVAAKNKETEEDKSKRKLQLSKEIFDYFVVGYVLSDEKKTRYLFKDTEKPSEFFVLGVRNEFTRNIWNLNELGVEQKKS